MEPGRTLLLALGMLVAAQVEVEDPPPLTYSAKPVRGVVVDAATGEPLADVVVVAQWVLFVSGPGHGGHGPRLHVTEAITNSEGKFQIPEWGPKPNPRYPWTRLRDEDPALSFFKRGYAPHYVQNRWDRNESVRFSEWDGKTIKLEKFTGTPEEWAWKLSLLQTSLAWGWEEVMDWRSIPRMALALELERLSLAQKKLKVSNISGLYEFATTIEEVREFLERQK